MTEQNIALQPSYEEWGLKTNDRSVVGQGSRIDRRVFVLPFGVFVLAALLTYVAKNPEIPESSITPFSDANTNTRAAQVSIPETRVIVLPTPNQVTSSITAETRASTQVAKDNFQKTLDWFRNQNDPYLSSIPDQIKKVPSIWIDGQSRGKYIEVGSNVQENGPLMLLISANAFGGNPDMQKATEQLLTGYYVWALANAQGVEAFQRQEGKNEEIYRQAEKMAEVSMRPTSK